MGSDPQGLTPRAMGETTKVKICGLKTEAALETALSGGADYVGLVFFPPSPRDLTPAVAKPLAAKARGRARIVALMVDPDDALLDAVVAAVDPDLLQLHGEQRTIMVVVTHSAALAERFPRRWSMQNGICCHSFRYWPRPRRRARMRTR